MDTEVAQQIATLQALIWILSGIIVVLCGHVLMQPLPEWKQPVDDPTCPLHKAPRSTCQKQHEDE